jgi:hypothetical protein
MQYPTRQPVQLNVLPTENKLMVWFHMPVSPVSVVVGGVVVAYQTRREKEIARGRGCCSVWVSCCGCAQNDGNHSVDRLTSSRDS